MWQKIVTTCSQHLLYATSVTKMWHFCSLLWLIDFLSSMENKIVVLPFTFCDNLISIFAVREAPSLDLFLQPVAIFGNYCIGGIADSQYILENLLF